MAVVGWLGRRLLHVAGLLLVVSLVSYLLLTLAPGDYWEPWKLSPLGVPKNTQASFVARYVGWVRSVLAGDWGTSVAYQRPVAELLLPRVGRTLLLTGTALGLAWLIGIPWGIFTARGKAKVSNAAASVLGAVPELVLALGLVWLAGSWRVAATSSGVWPVAVLTLAGLPPIWRHARAAMREVLEQPYVAAARAHGIPEGRLLWRHLLPAAANPLASLFGLQFGGLLSGSLIVEVIFGYPGLGPLLYEAIGARDLDVIHAAVLASAVCFAVGSLVSELLLYVTDPRLR